MSGVVREIDPRQANERQNSVKNSNEVSYWNGSFLIVILILSTFVSIPLLLVPQNDDIKHWQRRNDISSVIGRLIDYFFGYSLFRTLHLMFESKLLFKLKDAISFQVFIRFYVAKLIGFVVIPNLIEYLIWNVSLGNDNVMPFNAYLGLIGFPIPYVALWLQYPQELYYNKRGRRRFKAYIYYKFWRNFSMIPYLVSAIIVQVLPSDFQWVIAILLQINREIDYFISTKMLSNSTGALDKGAKTTITIAVNGAYAMYMTVLIGTKATTFSACAIIAVDFMLNLKAAFKIFRLQRKIEPDHLETEKKLIKIKQEVQTLSLMEIYEIIIPISYIVTFLIAYYGPNAHIYGHIRSSYWQYNPVENVEKLVVTVLSLFLVDVSSGIFGALLLSTSSINLLREGCKVLQQYWPIITLANASGIYIVRFKVFLLHNVK